MMLIIIPVVCVPIASIFTLLNSPKAPSFKEYPEVIAVIFFALSTILPLGLFISYIFERKKYWIVSSEGVRVGNSEEISWKDISSFTIRGFGASFYYRNKKQYIFFVDNNMIKELRNIFNEKIHA